MWSMRAMRVETSGVRGAMLLFALLNLSACGGEADEPSASTTAPEATGTPAAATPPGAAQPAPTGEGSAAAEDGGVPGVTPEEDAGVDAAVAVVRPEFTVPPYAAAPQACEPHPELAPVTPVSVRDLDRGVPDFPMVEAVNAACQHPPAELSATFNRGGLRRHRSRDYVQSQHYFGQALVADPSQLTARFNLACALARQDAIDEAIEQLAQLELAGPEGRAYAARAQTDADFGAYHGTPILAALVRGLPPAIDALPTTDDRTVGSAWDESTVELRGALVMLDGEHVWESGVLDATAFQAVVLAMEPDRRRFSFYAERPSDAVRAALGTLGLQVLTRHAGWSPSESRNYLVVPVSSRDEVRHTLYIGQLLTEDAIRPLESVELPAATCAEGVEAVQAFVVTPDHRAFGYVVGCLDAAPQTFQRCLFYFQSDELHRRCGQGTAPAAPAAGAAQPVPAE
jgi:hypothetical protein